jgi:protein-S-isoprenylcysteine O-methyltransferase Ste14
MDIVLRHPIALLAVLAILVVINLFRAEETLIAPLRQVRDCSGR